MTAGVLAATLLGACSDDGSGPDTATDDPSGPPSILVVDDPASQGMQVAQAVVETERQGGTVDFGLYGSPDGDDPFADGDLAVLSSEDLLVLDALPATADEEREVQGVRGAQAFVDRTNLGANVLTWQERDDLGIRLESHSLSVDELVTLAYDLSVDDDGVVEVGTLPDGVEKLEQIDDVQLTELFPTWVPKGAAGAKVEYHPSSGDIFGPSVTVQTVTLAGEAQADELISLLRQSHAGAEQVPAREGKAWLHDGLAGGEQSSGARVELFWPESPTVVLLVSSELPADTTLPLVEDLRTASESERGELADRPERDDRAQPEGEPVAEGTTAEGRTWQVRTALGTICGSIDIGGDGGWRTTCSPDNRAEDGLIGPGVVATTVVGENHGDLVFGVAPPGTVTVDVESDPSVTGQLYDAGDAGQVYVAEIAGEMGAGSEVVFRDADSGEIGRDAA